jgi:hypothetical protein
MIDNSAPPEVQRAAQVVQDWLDKQKAPTSTRPMSAAEKLDYCRQFDQTKMAGWVDPRTQGAK